MRRIFAGIVLAGALAACGQASSPPAMVQSEQAPAGGYAANAPEEARAAADMATAPSVAPAPPPMQGGEQGQPQQPGQTTGPMPLTYLAYTYGTTIELPAGNVASVMDAHIQQCIAAGPRLCQLIGSNKSGDPENYMEGYVNIRAEPRWLETFRNGLAAQADAAHGRIVTNTTNTEDLTRNIVDTEARTRALRTLRDRLQRLLDSRPGRLSDLLEVERELARVQGELDAQESTLAVMRTRVSMSDLTITYRSAPRPVGSDTFRPLQEAFANFLGIVVMGFAAIISIIAGLIPIAVVGVPIVWLLLRWRRRRGGRFFNRHPPASNAAETPPPGSTGS